MKTTYTVAQPTFCPPANVTLLPKTDTQDGHLIVLDDEKRVLSFLNARNGLGVAGNVSLGDDKAFQDAKDWLAKQVSEKKLVQQPTSQQSSPAPRQSNAADTNATTDPTKPDNSKAAK